MRASAENQRAGRNIRLRGARGALLVALATALASLPSTASAAIVIDPDAPAGVQYSAPLDRARAEAGGGGESTAGSPGSTEQAPLFGEGIEPASGSGGRGGSGGDSGGGPAASAAAIESLDQGSTGAATLRVGALSLAVLAVGGVAALLLRRRPWPEA